MPVKRPILANNEIYHVVSRGVDGRDIFNGDPDYYRAIHDLFEFNDTKPVGWEYRSSHLEIRSRGFHEIGSREIKNERMPRDLVVDILAFCLMPNHIHLLLRQVKDGGISFFMRKFGIGYAGYFNRKHERSGYLFQGRFRATHIKTDGQLKTVFVYIHTNPAALVTENWKEGGIQNPEEVIKFIENYKWSSYPDYLGQQNFPSVTQRDLFNSIMPKEEWQKYVNEWVEYKRMSGWDESAELE
jgi:putative transposase